MKLIGMLDSPYVRRVAISAKCLGIQLEHQSVSVFRHFEQAPQSFSWWDYRAAAFRRNHGLRIDLILASAAVAPACRECVIDREPRRLQRASDHTPVIAAFDI